MANCRDVKQKSKETFGSWRTILLQVLWIRGVSVLEKDCVMRELEKKKMERMKREKGDMAIGVCFFVLFAQSKVFL